MTSSGLKPLIAHPERNPSIIKNPDILVDLVAKTGAGVQITANSLVGGFGRGIRMCSQYLLKKRVVHIIGSDAHSTGARPPGLLSALKIAGKIAGRENVQKLVYANPEAVLSGGDLS
jgi:protein-tyrosine phosphatase